MSEFLVPPPGPHATRDVAMSPKKIGLFVPHRRNYNPSSDAYYNVRLGRGRYMYVGTPTCSPSPSPSHPPPSQRQFSPHLLYNRAPGFGAVGVSEAIAVGRAGVRAIGDIGGTLGGGGGGGGRGAIRSSESGGNYSLG